MINEFKTESIYITFYDDEKSFTMRDKKDVYNEMSAFNKNKRNYSKFKTVITDAIANGDTSSFWQWNRVADEVFNLKMHTWCAMD